MTIAACHVSPEGVVLGADSTTTVLRFAGAEGMCHFDHAQKLFEVGQPGSSVGMVTWGMGEVGGCSHRTIASELAAQHDRTPFSSLSAMAESLANIVWDRYSKAFAAELEFYRSCIRRNEEGERLEEAELTRALRLGDILRGGYCLGGRVGVETECSAFVVQWFPLGERPIIGEVRRETPTFWGVPKFIERLVYGCDGELLAKILESGKWSGTEDELFDLAASVQLIHPSHLPIREAVDWIHTVIHTTIRAIKFAQQPHYCGGPIEIAVVTSDRPFRWVLHKTLASAIG